MELFPVNQVTREHIATINDILDQMESVKESQVAIREGRKALAESLGVKAPAVTKILKLVAKQREESGTLAEEGEILEIATEASN